MDSTVAGHASDKPRVLVVDDERLLRAPLRMGLEGEGYEVIEAPDGVVALGILRDEHRPLVAVVDLSMPRMGGYELLREVTKDAALFQRHTFILMTASTSVPTEVSAFLALHCIPLLSKPFRFNVLLALIQNAAVGVTSRGQGPSSR